MPKEENYDIIEGIKLMSVRNRLKQKFVGPSDANDNKTGMSKFVLTTFDGDTPVQLVGLLDEMPEISFSVEYTDGPGAIWQDLLQEFMENGLFTLVNAIGSANFDESWKNLIHAGSWTKKVYNGYNPGAINLKFKIFSADTLGQSSAERWIEFLGKYAAISSKNEFSFSRAFENIQNGLKNMNTMGKDVGNEILKLKNSENATAADPNHVESAEESFKKEQQAERDLIHFLNNFRCRYVPIDYTEANENYKSNYTINIDQTTMEITLETREFTGVKGNLGGPKIEEDTKYSEKTIDSVYRAIEQLISKIGENKKYSRLSQTISASFKTKWRDTMEKTGLAEPKKKTDKLNQLAEQLNNLELYATKAGNYMNTLVNKYGPRRVSYSFNRNNCFGAKLWYLNLYSKTIFDENTPLIVYISNWSFKRSEEWNKSGHYYTEFSVTCNLDQTYSRAQWARVLSKNIIGNSKGWANETTRQRKVDSADNWVNP